MIRKFGQWSPHLGDKVYVDPQSTVIGQVTLADGVSVWPQVVIRGDVNEISVGERSNIQDLSMLHVTHKKEGGQGGFPLIIGADVTVGHKVMLHGCTIKDRCLIGMGTTVLDGAVLESDLIVGAGSLVPPGKTLESGFLWLGSPVKKIRELSESEIENLRYSAKHYCKLALQYIEEAAE